MTERIGVPSSSNNEIDVHFQLFHNSKLAEGRAKGLINNINFLQLSQYLDAHGIGRDMRNIDVDLLVPDLYGVGDSLERFSR